MVSESAAKNLAGEPVIASEGDYPNGLIMIRSGLARMSRRHHQGHHTHSYLSPGQVFGYEEIAAGQNGGSPTLLKYSLRAIGFVSVVTIPTPWVEKHLLKGDFADDAGPVPPESLAPEAQVPPLESTNLNHEFLEFLVQQRVVNGTQSMLIDMDRCTRCDDCVRACASTHDNNPRFVRQGPTFGNVMIANACMHCQDPVCMIECPTGAISRREEQGQVVINDTTCIGCSTCANNCPYDAIRMIEIRNQDGAFLRDTMTHLPILKATKCDLCVDQWGGPACQRACPHDALIRIDMRDVAGLAQWNNR
jgi:Fe-S-cluster-containing dehydrogenase component